MPVVEEQEFWVALDHAGRIAGLPPNVEGPLADALRAKFGRPLSEICTLRDVQRIDAVLRSVLMGKTAAPAQAEVNGAGAGIVECTFRFTPMVGAGGRPAGVWVQVATEPPAKGVLGSLPAAVLGRLMGVAKSLNLIHDAPALAAAVARAAKMLSRADVTTVFLLDRFTGLLRVAAHIGLPDTLVPIAVNPGDGTIGRVIATGRECWEARPSESLAPDDPVRALDAKSYVHIPLSMDGNAVGVLSAFAFLEDRFSESDVRLLTGLAEIAAAGIQRATERQELSKAEASNSMILSEAPLGIVAFDTEGRITHVNPEFIRLARVDCQNPRNLLGRNVFAQPVVLQNRLSQTLVALLRGDAFRQDFEKFVVDGETRAYDLQGRPLTNEAGIVVGGVVLMRDIQQRLNDTQALRRSEERHRQLFEHSRDALFVFNADHVIADANTSAAEMLGVEREAMGGRNAADLFPAGEAARSGREVLARLVRDGRLPRTEVEIARNDGTGFPAEINGVRLADGHYLVSARDITDRAELEAQVVHSQKMEAIGTLAGGVAHDFNNLLGGIMGYASLLREEMDLRPETRLALDSILSATETAKQRTSQLLAFARGGKYQVRPINLAELLTGLKDVITHSLDPRIRVSLEAPSSAVTVSGDAGQLSGALMNLLINARDAVGAEGRIAVTLKTRHYRQEHHDGDWTIEPGDYALIQIEDSGPGIPPGAIDKIFEPYFTTKGHEKASGLGLSVVLGVVEHHDGYVTVDSTPGEGTRFRVYLPLLSRALAETPAPVPPPRAAAGNGRKRILIAEDEQMLRTLAENVLSKSGYDVMSAEDGEKAVELFRNEGGLFDLVLLDMVMPRMGGDAAFARMREMRPEIPVLLSSGYSKDTVAQDLFSMGAAGFLEKPYDVTQLLDAVRRIIGR